MTNTTNYGLKKPDPNDYVNIEDLNYNADAIDTVLASLSTDLSNKADKLLPYNNGDITNIPKVSGTYSIGANVTGMPFSGGCLAQVASDGHSVAITVWFGNTQYIRVGSGEIWDDWDILATTTPPQEYDLPISVSTTANLSKYHKNAFDEVIFDIYIALGASVDNGSVIASFPEGFRPKFAKTLVMSGVLIQGNVRFVGSFSITTSGDIMLFSSEPSLPSGTIIFGGGTFGA